MIGLSLILLACQGTGSVAGKTCQKIGQQYLEYQSVHIYNVVESWICYLAVCESLDHASSPDKGAKNWCILLSYTSTCCINCAAQA